MKRKKQHETQEARVKKLQLEIFNPETEERRPAITLIRRPWDGPGFFMGFQKAFVELARKKLTSGAKNILLLILGKIDYENELKLSQAEIAKLLGMRKQNVSRAITQLVEEGVLQPQDPKRHTRIRLNNRYAWRGTLKTLRARQRSLADTKKTNDSDIQ
jgi:DNA-binding MarR family transcriptional regulator